MVVEPLPPGVHVILGDSAGGSFLQAFHPSRDHLIIDRDVLSCGPTPRCESLEDWEAMRLQFWNGIVPFGPEELPHSTMGLTERAQHLRDAAHVTLWAGTGVSEQLSIASTIHLATQNDVDPDKFSMVQFEYFPGSRDEVSGLGMLAAEAMRSHPEAKKLSAVTLRDYTDAWTALTASQPDLIEQFAGTHPGANRWLQRAMKLLLRRFPDRQSGLNFWDRALLAEVTAQNKKAARIVGDTIGHHWNESDPVGDFFLFGRLLGLAHRAEPLIELFGDGMNMRYTEVRLTPFGRDVLEGRASNYPANGIEDWAAGVRLSSRDGALWFNDGGRLVRA